MERTLVLVKPDAMQRGLAFEVLGRLEARGLRLAVHDAGRGRIAWAAYAAGGASHGPPMVIEAPRQDDAASCARDAPPGALWCGA